VYDMPFIPDSKEERQRKERLMYTRHQGLSELELRDEMRDALLSRGKFKHSGPAAPLEVLLEELIKLKKQMERLEALLEKNGC